MQGGEKAREITPLGYFGNPSEIDLEGVKGFEEEMTRGLPNIILYYLREKKNK